jgi:5-formyltetrahydrofolate cyclo-ligase
VLRRELTARGREVPADVRVKASAAALSRIRDQSEWRVARRVLLYAPLADELDLSPLMVLARAEGRLLALPRFDGARGEYGAAAVGDPEQDVVPGQFGIREPAAHCPAVPLNQLDFALVPGLGFDREGRRLGRGRGFYDRLLTAFHGTACGVAMDWQVRESIPAEPHDKLVDCILTPTRWLAVARRCVDP